MYVNNITVSGNLGRDSELRAGNTPALNFSIANTNPRRDETTTWFNCVVFGKRAESLAQYLKKGTGVVVQGEVSLRTYTDKNNAERQSLNLVVNDLTFIPSPKAGERANGSTASAGFDDDEAPF